MSFTKQAVHIAASEETARIVSMLRQSTAGILRRHGAVVGVSGGVDSAVVLALCVRAFGARKVLALLMPERESDPDSERLARLVARKFGVEPLVEDITAALEGCGCYARRDAAIRRVFPDYDPAAGHKVKIVLPEGLLERNTLNVFSLTIQRPNAEDVSLPVPARELLQIVAASNFKQRTRMAMLYYHSECNQYAVVGTANKNEHDQGFFVKHGDAGVDVKPIAHLYKTQVYDLAAFLGVPEEIRRRPPTSDTYSAACTQEEFFFRLPFETMDVLWYAMEHDVPVSEVAQELGVSEVQIRRAFDDFDRKRRTTAYLRTAPLGIADVVGAGY